MSCPAQLFTLLAVSLSLALVNLVSVVEASNEPPKHAVPFPEVQCDSIAELFRQVDEDMKAWPEGVKQDEHIAELEKLCYQDSYLRTHLVCVLIRDGKVYLTSVPHRIKSRQHAVSMEIGPLQDLYETSLKYKLPDAQFVLYTGDIPQILTETYKSQKRAPPMLVSHSKAPGYADVLIPMSHFRCGTNSFDWMWQHVHSPDGKLANMPPWEERRPIALGRYTHFCAGWDSLAFAPKLKQTGGQRGPCPRKYLPTLAIQHPGELDVWSWGLPCQHNCKPLTIQEHTHYKYMLSTDGWTASSKLEKYMLLNSTILKAQSPLIAFFYHLLERNVHYVPFMEEHQDDVLDVIRNMREHDDFSRQIAQNAFAFANKYLTRNARLCYWKAVVEGLARKTNYTPDCANHEHCWPAEEEINFMLKNINGASEHCPYPVPAPTASPMP